MSMILLAIAAATTAGPMLTFPPISTGGYDRNRLVATMPLYPANRADDVRRPGFNGRLWIGDINIGPEHTSWPMGWGDPGPEAYGAAGSEDARAYVRQGLFTASINPWVAINAPGLEALEFGRNEWLKERGYVGGVRTFVNDMYLNQYMNDARHSSSAITPRATFQLPDEMPRFKERQQVMHESGSVKAASLGKVSLPPMAGKAMTQRLAVGAATQVASK
jgi:hypothetical protein